MRQLFTGFGSALTLAVLGLHSVAAPAAIAAPVVDKGDTAWMLVATCLVVVMTIPGLALFYGGLVRAKNVLSILMQVFICFCMITVLWVVYGYSLAFSGGNAFIGGLSKLFLAGVDLSSLAPTFSKEIYLPEYVYIIFQLTFAAITPALITGAFAERMKFQAVLLFLVVWFTFSYLPMAHMVWWWAGPDAYTLSAANAEAMAAAVGESAAREFLARLGMAPDEMARAAVLVDYAAAVGASNGWLFRWGALDFAGGAVVHINAGIAGLVCALMLGRRVGHGREPMAPHNLVLTMVGSSLLWVGWFGFNAGSNLEANGLAALAILNTMLAAAAAAIAWSIGERLFQGHPSLLGSVSGAVAGLVAITPACGWVGPGGALTIGLVAGLVCLWSVVWLKSRLGYDDSLDVFGVHGVGGILGSLLTGIFVAPDLGGTGLTDYAAFDASVQAVAPAIGSQVLAQAVAVLTVAVLSATVSFFALLICKATVGLRVSEQEEREGLDIVDHGERAYN